MLWTFQLSSLNILNLEQFKDLDCLFFGHLLVGILLMQPGLHYIKGKFLYVTNMICWGDLLRSILLKNITFLINITQEQHVFGKFRLLWYTEVVFLNVGRAHFTIFFFFFFFIFLFTLSRSVFLVLKDKYLFVLASGLYVVMCYALLNPLVL